MYCPHCGGNMKETKETYWSIGDWDMDYPTGYIERHICVPCKIKATNTDPICSKYTWEIPEKYHPTDKQRKTVKFICNVLHISPPPETKRQYWWFINDNLNDAIETNEANKELYFEDNFDWLPEHF